MKEEKEHLEEEKLRMEQLLKNQRKKTNERIMIERKKLEGSAKRYIEEHKKKLNVLLTTEKAKNKELQEQIENLQELQSKKRQEVTTKLKGTTKDNRHILIELRKLKATKLALGKENKEIKELLQAVLLILLILLSYKSLQYPQKGFLLSGQPSDRPLA